MKALGLGGTHASEWVADIQRYSGKVSFDCPFMTVFAGNMYRAVFLSVVPILLGVRFQDV